jgi:hypothetical protein
MGLNLIPYDYSVSIGVYQDDWLGLDLFLRIITTFPCYGVVGLAMESRLCLQIDE